MEKCRKYATIRSKMYSPGRASVDLADVPRRATVFLTEGYWFESSGVY